MKIKPNPRYGAFVVELKKFKRPLLQVGGGRISCRAAGVRSADEVA